MQQVVLFSSDFEKESADFMKRELEKVDIKLQSGEFESNKHLSETPYSKLEIDISARPVRIKEILERYRGPSLGLPPEWFNRGDKIEVNIIQRNIKITGKPELLILMPKQGTPVRGIVNDDFAHNPTLSLFFITNLNFGDPGNLASFELACDEKLVRIKGNIDLLNQEFEGFNEKFKYDVSHHIENKKQLA